MRLEIVVDRRREIEESLKTDTDQELSGTIVIGAAICLDGLLPAVFSEKLVFSPFSPVLTSDAYLAWKRGTTPSPAARALIDLLGGS